MGLDMTLEETIMKLTSRTPSGGSCWIGDVSFIVRYCSDCWEWEYLGDIFFDPLDLAEAILRGSTVVSGSQHGLSLYASPMDRRR